MHTPSFPKVSGEGKIVLTGTTTLFAQATKGNSATVRQWHCAYSGDLDRLIRKVSYTRSGKYRSVGDFQTPWLMESSKGIRWIDHQCQENEWRGAGAVGLLERAISLATALHAGTRDKGGQPYIEHPLRVMGKVSGELEKVVAVLHDVVEDTPATLGELAAAGFPAEVIAALDHLTRREGEDYAAFIARAGANSIGKAVKIADIEDNMNICRIPAPTADDWRRLEKYQRAYISLTSRVAPDESLGLMRDIARCPGVTGFERCRGIVNVQGINGHPPDPTAFQLPEPWSGQLETAPILFVASNPGFAPSEEYPRSDWPDALIFDFFRHRFGGGIRPWVKGYLHPLLAGCDAAGKDLHKHEWVRYWAAVRKQASRLLARPAVPGPDYAMTEVVHCKSAGEKGVADAVRTCSDRYLDRILGLSPARVVVALGAVAAKELRRRAAPESNREALIGPVQVVGATRFVLFLPHPNAYGVKSVERLLSDQERRMIRECLAG